MSVRKIAATVEGAAKEERYSNLDVPRFIRYAVACCTTADCAGSFFRVAFDDSSSANAHAKEDRASAWNAAIIMRRVTLHEESSVFALTCKHACMASPELSL